MRKTILLAVLCVGLSAASAAAVGVLATLKAIAVLGTGIACGITADSRLKFWH